MCSLVRCRAQEQYSNGEPWLAPGTIAAHARRAKQTGLAQAPAAPARQHPTPLCSLKTSHDQATVAAEPCKDQVSAPVTSAHKATVGHSPSQGPVGEAASQAASWLPTNWAPSLSFDLFRALYHVSKQLQQALPQSNVTGGSSSQPAAAAAGAASDAAVEELLPLGHLSEQQGSRSASSLSVPSTSSSVASSSAKAIRRLEKALTDMKPAAAPGAPLTVTGLVNYGSHGPSPEQAADSLFEPEVADQQLLAAFHQLR